MLKIDRRVAVGVLGGIGVMLGGGTVVYMTNWMRGDIDSGLEIDAICGEPKTHPRRDIEASLFKRYVLGFLVFPTMVLGTGLAAEASGTSNPHLLPFAGATAGANQLLYSLFLALERDGMFKKELKTPAVVSHGVIGALLLGASFSLLKAAKQ